MPKFTNISNGPRGIHTTSGLVTVEPGQTVDVELAVTGNTKAGEKQVTEEPVAEWFAAEGTADAKAASGDLDGLTKAQLLDLAKAENVAVETDDNKADLIGKIEAARK